MIQSAGFLLGRVSAMITGPLIIMMALVRRYLLAWLLLLAMSPVVHGGITPETAFTSRGQTDFDTFLQLLNPYGTWSKIGGKWAFTPLDHQAPYRNGRWIYTEYGWYWKGNLPYSWATEHYGYWKRGADKVWSWYPGPFWLPEIVEIRATDAYIGWRSGEVDNDGGFVEAPIDRYSKSDEWTFVTKEQFANPITPADVAGPMITRDQLDNSTDCNHTYMTYRAIDRPGPHPADEARYCKDGGMLAPKTMEEEKAELAAAAKKPATPTGPAAKMTGTNQPELLGEDVPPGADMRRVKYWVTMSLPTLATKPPAEAKPEEIYIYRPDLYQDNDGIERRITLWFNPQQRTTLKDLVSANEAASATKGAKTPVAALPAVPVGEEPTTASDAFRVPLDDSYHSPAGGHPTTNSAAGKSAMPSGTTPVPSGLAH